MPPYDPIVGLNLNIYVETILVIGGTLIFCAVTGAIAKKIVHFILWH